MSVKSAIAALRLKFETMQLEIPENLISFLATAKPKGCGSDDPKKRRKLYGFLYERIAAEHTQCRGRTVVLPDVIRAVVRARYPKNIRCYDQQHEGDEVYHVTMTQLAEVKWPALPGQ